MARSQGGRPFLAATFGARNNPQPRNDRIRLDSIRLIQEMGKHSLGVIRATRVTRSFEKFLGNNTVDFVIGRGDNLLQFCGYITHVKPTMQRRLGTADEADIYCIGATHFLKGARNKTYDNMTAIEMAADVCKRNRLALTAHTNDWRFTESQHGRSDWKFLCDLADKIGFVIIPRGVEILFVNRSKLTNLLTPCARTLTLGRDLHKVTPILGDESPRGGRKLIRVGYGLTDRGDDLAHIDWGDQDDSIGRGAGLPTFNEYARHHFGSQQELRQTLKAENRKNKWTFQADATARGDVRVRAGSAVALEGLGQDGDGIWSVERVEHRVTLENFTMSLKVGRDGFGDSGRRPPQGRLTPDPLKPVTPRITRNNGWVAPSNKVTLL